MIFNISGRTDVVNYYTPWLLNRIHEGYVYVRNPYNKKQVTCYSLKPDDVDAFVFCSKNYTPILDYIDAINREYNTFYYYTITSYDSDVEVNVLSVEDSVETFIELSEIVGKDSVAWRFDPMLLTDKYNVSRHLETFEKIASRISNYAGFVVFSFVDMYSKLNRNMPEIIPFKRNDIHELLSGMSSISKKYGLSIQSCLINNDYTSLGINNSGCVTTDILERANNIKFKKINHNGNRPGCKCIKWHDIGAYDTCPNGCKYCYANKNKHVARHNYRLHNPSSPILFGNITDDDKISVSDNKSLLAWDKYQTTLF